MVRRVKAYLNNMKVITDEDQLHQMSMECEPPSGGVPSHAFGHANAQAASVSVTAKYH
jgi:Rap guanine nucleotide exchange factor 2